MEFFWAISVQINYDKLNYYKLLKKKFLLFILDKLGYTEHNKLLLTNNTVQYFDRIQQILNCNKTDYMKEKELNQIENDIELYNPIFPDKTYTHIDIKNIKKMKSASNPIICPMVNDNNNDNIMYKNENLLKDQIIVKIIKLIDIILKREEKLDLDIIKYNVIPTSNLSGFVEIVPESTTVYNILEKHQYSIQNFIIEHNKNKTVTEIRNKFTKSTAAYCIISYILGIGDRHLDNIMISKSGALFHIDFGYILGCDPKYASNNIKITHDILDAMGGINSSDYVMFQQLCSQIYNCLRRHTNLFMNLLLMLLDFDTFITRDNLIKEIIKRFEPGENIMQANIHINNIMNYSKDTYEHKVVDFVHKSFKENNTLSTLGSIINVATNSGSYIYNKII
jgi:phosphatidylinositol kinase/protein kinase (PI-3  family)